MCVQIFTLKTEDQRSQSLCGITIREARKVNSNDSGRLLFFIIVSPGRAGAFSRDFTTILAPECKAFSGSLKIEKLKAPQIPGPMGAVDTSDWCIKSPHSWNIMYSRFKSNLEFCLLLYVWPTQNNFYLA